METQLLTNADIVGALLDQSGADDARDKRRTPRRACVRGVSVSVTEACGADEQVILIAAVTSDVSDEGLSLICPRTLAVGSELSIRFETLENLPILKGVVRHVVDLGGEYHRIGVEFIQ